MQISTQFFGGSKLSANASSQKWYGPATKRYQVSAGMSLSTPPWVKSEKDKSKLDLEASAQSIPPAPPAHLTAKNIVYEVDVPIVEPTPDETSSPEDKSERLRETIQMNAPDSDFDEIPRTARDYGQKGKGAAQEWVIRRRLGDGALSASNSTLSSSLSTLASINNMSVMTTTLEDGSVVVDLDPPEPGRLRLLSGITCSFRPSTMTALMGESGAGKVCLVLLL